MDRLTFLPSSLGWEMTSPPPNVGMLGMMVGLLSEGILDMRLPSMSVTLFMCALMADMPSLYSCREIDDESSFANAFVKPSVLGTLSKRGGFEVAPVTSTSFGLSSCDI